MQLSAMPLEIDGFAYSFLQFHWKSMVSHTAFWNFTGNLWFRMQRSAISLEIDGIVYSFLQFHWKSMVSHAAF